MYSRVLTTLNVLYLVVVLFEVRTFLGPNHIILKYTLGVAPMLTCELQNTLPGSDGRERMGLFSEFIEITYDSLTTILVVDLLVRLQEAAHPGGGSVFLWSGASESVGTLQFARADVDSWARETGSGLSPSAEVAVEKE